MAGGVGQRVQGARLRLQGLGDCGGDGEQGRRQPWLGRGDAGHAGGGDRGTAVRRHVDQHRSVQTRLPGDGVVATRHPTNALLGETQWPLEGKGRKSQVQKAIDTPEGFGGIFLGGMKVLDREPANRRAQTYRFKLFLFFNFI